MRKEPTRDVGEVLKKKDTIHTTYDNLEQLIPPHTPNVFEITREFGEFLKT